MINKADLKVARIKTVNAGFKFCLVARPGSQITTDGGFSSGHPRLSAVFLTKKKQGKSLTVSLGNDTSTHES